MANFKLTQTGEQIQADLNLLDNNSATSGQVLTADGNGGASWQTPSGGGSGLYYHTINLTAAQDPDVIATFGLYSTRSEAFTLDSFCRYLYNFEQGLKVTGYIQAQVDPAEETSDYGIFNTLFVMAPHENENYIYLHYFFIYETSKTTMATFVFDTDVTFEAFVMPA